MRLKPDDIMRKGDEYHIRGGEVIVINGYAGEPASCVLMDGEYIERPEVEEPLDETKETMENIRDLARTGLAPDAFNMTQEQWLQHKLNRIASMAAAWCEKHKEN